MARYHVNPHTGNPGQCSARISCPYGNLETDHFNSAADARKAYEAGKLDATFTTLSKALDEVAITKARETDQAIIDALEADPKWHTITVETTFEDFTKILEDDSQGDDQAIIDALKANPKWMTFDPSMGPEQLEGTFDERSAMTDETMDEMASHMEANPTVEVQGINGKEPSYRVMANGQEAFITYSSEVARTAERAALAGEWGAMSAVEDESKWTRLNHEVRRGTNDLATARQQTHVDIAEYSYATEPRLMEAGKAAKRDLAIQNVAFAILTDEESKANFKSWMSSEGDAPF